MAVVSSARHVFLIAKYQLGVFGTPVQIPGTGVCNAAYARFRTTESSYLNRSDPPFTAHLHMTMTTNRECVDIMIKWNLYQTSA